MKKTAIIFILTLINFGCSVNRKSVKNSETAKAVVTELHVSEQVIDIRVPKSDISIFDQIALNSDGSFTPRVRTVKVPETNQTLEYKISPQGELKIRSVAPADTIRKKNKDVTEKSNTVQISKTSNNVNVKLKFSLGGFLKNVLNTFIPGLGDLFDSVFKVVGGIVTFVGILVLTFILSTILLIRRLFKRRKDNSS